MLWQDRSPMCELACKKAPMPGACMELSAALAALPLQCHRPGHGSVRKEADEPVARCLCRVDSIGECPALARAIGSVDCRNRVALRVPTPGSVRGRLQTTCRLGPIGVSSAATLGTGIERRVAWKRL